MAYRRLTERNRASEQLFMDILRRLRFLERRVRYPGRVRSLNADTIEFSTPGATVVGSVNIGAGAWVCLAAIDAYHDTPNTGFETLASFLEAYDQDTDALVATVDSRTTTETTGAATDLFQSLTMIGHASFAAPVQLRLSVGMLTSGAAHAVELRGIKIIAMPV